MHKIIISILSFTHTLNQFTQREKEKKKRYVQSRAEGKGDTCDFPEIRRAGHSIGKLYVFNMLVFLRQSATSIKHRWNPAMAAICEGGVVRPYAAYEGQDKLLNLFMCAVLGAILELPSNKDKRV